MRASQPDVPVLFLTARDSVEDRVAGLTAGGDDYVTKPFSLEEVVARLRALMRRAGARPARDVLGPRRRRPRAGRGQPRGDRGPARRSRLTATEFELLRYLMRNPRRVLSKAQILDRVWNYDFGGQANVVELYISYLRKKVDAGTGADDPHDARRGLRAQAGRLTWRPAEAVRLPDLAAGAHRRGPGGRRLPAHRGGHDAGDAPLPRRPARRAGAAAATGRAGPGRLGPVPAGSPARAPPGGHRGAGAGRGRHHRCRAVPRPLPEAARRRRPGRGWREVPADGRPHDVRLRGLGEYRVVAAGVGQVNDGARGRLVVVGLPRATSTPRSPACSAGSWC